MQSNASRVRDVVEQMHALHDIFSERPPMSYRKRGNDFEPNAVRYPHQITPLVQQMKVKEWMAKDGPATRSITIGILRGKDRRMVMLITDEVVHADGIVVGESKVQDIDITYLLRLIPVNALIGSCSVLIDEAHKRLLLKTERLKGKALVFNRIDQREFQGGCVAAFRRFQESAAHQETGARPSARPPV